MIRVQQEDFDIGAEIAHLKAGRSDIGAIVAFVGTVRDRAGDQAVEEMTLEHYPGMTEAELQRIEADACSRWPLQGCLIVHRTGTLRPSDNIVLVVTANGADKGDDGADVAASSLQLRDLGADVEILMLNADHASLRSPAGKRRSRARSRSQPHGAHGSGRSQP